MQMPTPTNAIQMPPLTLNDLIDLHFMLEADELFMALMRASITGVDQ